MRVAIKKVQYDEKVLTIINKHVNELSQAKDMNQLSSIFSKIVGQIEIAEILDLLPHSTLIQVGEIARERYRQRGNILHS